MVFAVKTTGAVLENTIFHVALGANQPSDACLPVETLKRAVALIAKTDAEVIRHSGWWRTPAFPPGSGPEFVNAVITVKSVLAPADFLAMLHDVEHRLGRVRAKRWGPRVCDLDVLACGNLVAPDLQTVAQLMEIGAEAAAGQPAPDQMILPHPRLHERAFVLVPLCEVAPDWEHPVLKRSAAQLLSDLPQNDIAEVERQHDE